MFYEALFLIVLLTLISAVVFYLVKLWLDRTKEKPVSTHPLDANFEAAYTPANAREQLMDLPPVDQPESDNNIPPTLEPSEFEESQAGHELIDSMSKKRNRLKNKQRNGKRKEGLKHEKSV